MALGAVNMSDEPVNRNCPVVVDNAIQGERDAWHTLNLVNDDLLVSFLCIDNNLICLGLCNL